MPRVKRGPKRAARRTRTLELASGYFLTKSKLHRSAQEAVERALKFAYTGRKRKKRDFRSLWIVRINAAGNAPPVSHYSKFMHGLKLAGIKISTARFSPPPRQRMRGSSPRSSTQVKAAIAAQPKTARARQIKEDP